MSIIPIQAIPNQTFRIVLDGQNMTFKLYYRFGSCYMDIYKDQTLLQAGAVCNNGANILTNTAAEFNGSLHFWDTGKSQTPPDWNGFGSRYLLLYVSKEEELPEALKF